MHGADLQRRDRCRRSHRSAIASSCSICQAESATPLLVTKDFGGSTKLPRD
jgi:hypothetical protein